MALFDMPGRVGGLSAEARAGAATAAKRRAEQRSACDSMILEAKLQQATRQTFAMAMFGDPPSPRPSGAPPARPRRTPSRSRAEIHVDSESDASDGGGAAVVVALAQPRRGRPLRLDLGLDAPRPAAPGREKRKSFEDLEALLRRRPSRAGERLRGARALDRAVNGDSRGDGGAHEAGPPGLGRADAGALRWIAG